MSFPFFVFSSAGWWPSVTCFSGVLLHAPTSSFRICPNWAKIPLSLWFKTIFTTSSAYLSDFPWHCYCHCGSGNTNLLLGHQHLRKVLDTSKATRSQSFPCMSPLMGSTNSVVMFRKDHSPISNAKWHLPPHRFTHVKLSVIATKLANRQ